MARAEPSVGVPVAWATPGEPVPVRLMNTIWADRGGVHDALSNRGRLGDWLRVVGLTATPVTVTKDDLVIGLRLRDALRRLAALLTEDVRPAAVSAIPDVSTAINEINTIASSTAGPRLQLRHGVLEQDTSPVGRPVPAALAAVASESIDLLTGTTAPLLRACHAPGCVLYFVKDHPRREWCSAACGNRVRAARHYARHSGHTSATDPKLSRPTPR
ncbi:CGNR zinc finger domain-containing protein [Kribbella sp. NBC_01484]|uniref:CGNR zinc finger domain-containing protein n=1 Tax=Kribbella sp. NBC_01484 TaxID=2903579 RepID=UPI002E33E394|nr:CGNR zinc finger domain-containing protein [Kribbella sp. NBC_01484]